MKIAQTFGQIRFFFGGTLVLALLSACDSGSSSPIPHFVAPSSLAITSKDVTFEGRVRRLGYVSNFSAGTISVVDIRDRRVMDTDNFDDEETPITVGGTPIAVLQWRPSTLPADVPYRLVVVDSKNSRLIIIDAEEDTNSNNDETITHRFVDLGGSQISVAGTPVYFNQERPSNPTISAIQVHSKARQENWRIVSLDDKSWEVEGSISGTQEKRVTAGESYTTDGGEITFTILENDRRADRGDVFFVGISKFKPFTLTNKPRSVAISGDKLYLANQDSATLDVLDLNTRLYDASIALNDGSGFAPIPGKMKKNGNDLVITNLSAGNSIFIVDTVGLSSQSFNVGASTRSLIIKNDIAFLLASEQPLVLPFDTLGGALSGSSIAMANIPIAALLLKGDEDVNGDALIVNIDNTIDLVNLQTRKRIDTDDRGETESFASGTLFFNAGPHSNPSLSEPITQDGVTKTEKWVALFEGVIVDTPSNDALITSNALNDVTANFTLSGVQADDLLIVKPNDPAHTEEIVITEVVDANNLTLASAPDAQGGSISYEIRANARYTLKGSVSGFQNQRIREGVGASSDNDEVTFSVSPASTSSPTTRGDYFSFETNDGITPIAASGDFTVDAALFEQDAYLLNQNSNDISIVHVPALEDVSGID